MAKHISPRLWPLGRSLVAVGLAGFGLAAAGCDRDTDTVPVSTQQQELRDEANLHPVERKPAPIPTGDAGLLGVHDPKLRDKAGLSPVGRDDHAKTPQELRDRLNIVPDKQPPPENAEEMRERMGLHPERIE